MKIQFNISFHTIWGQKLVVSGSIPELGNWKLSGAKEMHYVEGGNWQLEIDIPADLADLHYRYLLVENGNPILEEWNKGHSACLDPSIKTYSFYDTWEASPSELSYYSTAFTKAIYAHLSKRPNHPDPSGKKLRIKVWAPRVESHQSVALAGNQSLIGNWQVDKALKMTCETAPEWQIEIDADQIRYPFEYKFIVCNTETSELNYWEAGDNRILNLPPAEEGEIKVVSGLFLKKELPEGKFAGTVVPVFSLRTEKSFGVGDFGDLKQLVDWVKSTGQRVIQILPVNDTTNTHTWTDSYPYSAVSIYALHPIYIDLQAAGTPDDAVDRAYYEQIRKDLNSRFSVEYEEVLKTKLQYMKVLFWQEGKEVLASDEFETFFLRNLSWLVPYAAYCYLRDTYHTTDFSRWGEYATYNKVRVHAICDELADSYPEVAFTYYLQFILRKQFESVTSYARKNGIVLKGDLPIGIGRTSVDAWTDPSYFNLQSQAGAPPDEFSTIGQNWRFPTYCWDVMEKDQYTWWKKRFEGMGHYFDCFRIDHILGFFRIWEIPEEYVQGLCGHFRPALPLSRKEIEQYGFTLIEPFHMTAHINEAYLPLLFDDLTSVVIDTYLDRITSQFYALKSFCNTQRKIEFLFRERTDPASERIREGLYTIANEVLFLRDPYEKEKFHPRISASQSYVYKDLFSSDQYAFDQLYWDFYYHRHNDFWKAEAYKRLTPLIAGTEMLVCGEDLGMIPDSVHEVMNRLQILSLELERMPKVAGREFSDLSDLPYLSVCTTSTHDMPPLRAWWREDALRTQRYYNQVLRRDGEAPGECSSEIATQILWNHLTSPSMFAIFPLQDWLAIDDELKNPDVEAERINVPADPNHYWGYRMHLTIEKLKEAADFNRKVKDLIAQSGRKK